MIKIDQKRYQEILNEIIKSKDYNRLVSSYLNNRVFYCSIIVDILDKDSRNKHLIKSVAKKNKISVKFVQEQAQNILSFMYPEYSSDNDYYEILNVDIDSSSEEIRSQWMKLISEYHPDKIGDEGVEISARLNEAYSVLKDNNKRLEYDKNRLPIKKIYVSRKKSFNRVFRKKIIYLFVLLSFFILGLIIYFSFFNQKQVVTFDYDKKQRVEKKNKTYDEHISELIEKNLKNKNNSEYQNLIEEEKRLDEELSLLTKKDNKLNYKSPKKPESPKKNDLNIKPVKESSVQSNTENIIKPISVSTTNNQERSKIDVIQDEEINKKIYMDTLIEKESAVNSQISSFKKNTEPLRNEIKIIKTSTAFNSNNDIPPNAVTVHQFIREYVDAYKNKDVDSISSFFLDNGYENGQAISTVIKNYKNNFANMDILNYDIKIKNTKINNYSSLVTSNFSIKFKNLSTNNTKVSSGNIDWNLQWNNTDWKIKELRYSVTKTELVN